MFREGFFSHFIPALFTEECCPVCTGLSLCVNDTYTMSPNLMTIAANEENTLFLFKDCTKPSAESSPFFHQQPYFSIRNATQVIYITESRMINIDANPINTALLP